MRSLFLLTLLLGACASPGGGEKGGLRAASVGAQSVERIFEPRRFALAVGIGELDDEGWRDLRFAAKDARDLGSALADSERGAFERVIVLTRTEETSRERILAELEQLRRLASRPDDIIVVYISAHGTLARDGRGELKRYIVTRETRYRDIPGTALSIDLLNQRLEQFTSKRRLLVLATCHSGSGKSLLPAELEREVASTKSGFLARPLEDVSRATMLLAASDWGETAREDEVLENDIYTHFLLEAVDGRADRNGDGAVSAYEAHDHARRRTFAFTGGRQRPSAELLEVGADPILLAGHLRRQGQPELYSYNPRLDGFTLKVDGQERTELPGGTSVRAGVRKIELTKGDATLFSRSISVGLGERLELEELLHAESPRRSVFLAAGTLSFLDGRQRREILPATLTAGLAVRWDDFPLQRLALWVDLHGFSGSSRLSLGPEGWVPFGYRTVHGGMSSAYTWELGRFRLYAGPRVAGLWLRRSFQLEAYQEQQSYFTLSSGVLTGMSFALSPSLELSTQGNLMLTYVVVDGRGNAVGSTGGWLGAGYRF